MNDKKANQPSKLTLRQQLQQALDELENVRAEVLECQRQRDQQNQQVVQLVRETEKKRQHLEGVEKPRLAAAAQTEVVSRLLPLLDNLDRAFKSVPGEIRDNEWVKGITLIEQQLQGYLKELDLTPIEVVGLEFDPHTMEAVSSVVDASKTPNSVVEEVLRGYSFRGQVLRPAHVKVVQKGQPA